MITIHLSSFQSPIGLLHLAHVDDCLYALNFEEFYDSLITHLHTRYADAELVEGSIDPRIQQALQRYFAGEINALDTLPVHASGTPFQQHVWQGLRQIPAGNTYSYQQLAQYVGNMKAQRAVGTANGRNPIPLVIPCHRVINSNGKLGGFGGKLWRKEWLLKHEGVAWRG
jgi:O-6-methylguanine DNA methyltransferase